MLRPQDPVPLAVERIAASTTFSRAPRAVDLLRGVTRMVGEGRGQEIKEYTLAAEVFGRADYDPKVDSGVRVEAARLRTLLAKYYEAEGAEDLVRIEIPKGSYTPVITVTPPPPAPTQPTPPAPASEASAPRSNRIWLAAAAVAAVAITGAGLWKGRENRPPRFAPRPSIAVMPFLDLSAGHGQDRFADGLTQELTSALSQWSGVEVASFTSVQQYNGQRVDVRRAGRELGVHAILEGSIRFDGTKLRVTAQFTSARSGFGIWSQSWDRDAADPLAVQSDITREIVAHLKYDMHGTRRAIVLPPARTVEAWSHYLRAVRTAENLTGLPSEQAGEMLAAAVAADPDYALGWAALAKWTCRQYEWGFDGRAILDRAADAAGRAVAADRGLPEAHEADARAKMLRDRDWSGAERAFRRALEIEPAHVDSLYGLGRLVLGPQGRFDEAIEQLRRALRIDETRFDVQLEIVNSLIKAGRLAEASEELDRSPVKGTSMGDILMGRILTARGQAAESLTHFARAVAQNRGKWSLGYYGYGLAAAERTAQARRVLAELEAVPLSAVEQAMIHTRLGDRARALELIEQAEKLGPATLFWMKVVERLAELRAEPRFTAVLGRIGL